VNTDTLFVLKHLFTQNVLVMLVTGGLLLYGFLKLMDAVTGR
jgi:hypothetical protein